MSSAYRFLMYYPYEYKALEGYLTEMMKKGYKLEILRGPLRYMMVFERCEPEKLYYYVDYHDSKLFSTKSQSSYREFIEEYGYTFESEYGPIQVYSSKQVMEIPIREENGESLKEMRRIMWYDLIGNLILALLYSVLVFLQIRSLSYDFFSDLSYVPYIYIALALVFLYMVLSKVWWLLHPKMSDNLKKVKVRTFVSLFSIYLAIVFMLSLLHPLIGFGLSVLVMGVVGVNVIWDVWRQRLEPLSAKLKRLLIPLLVLLLSMIPVFSREIESVTKKDVVLDGYTYEPSWHKESMFSSYAVYEEESDRRLTIVVMKNSPIRDFLVDMSLANREIETTDTFKDMKRYTIPYEVYFVVDGKILIVHKEFVNEEFREEAYRLLKEYKE